MNRREGEARQWLLVIAVLALEFGASIGLVVWLLCSASMPW